LSSAVKKGKRYFFHKARHEDLQASHYEGNALVLLLKAEKYWAAAMTSRQNAAQNPRAKFAVSAKLRRAVQQARLLRQAVDRYSHERTTV
jgi:hypothetical protein